jgi:hypothetical protein
MGGGNPSPPPPLPAVMPGGTDGGVQEAGITGPGDVEIAARDGVLYTGRTTDYSVQITRKGTFTGAVDITVSGLPAGVSAAAVQAGPGVGSAIVKITVASDVKHSAYPVKVEAKSSDGTLMKSTMVSLFARATPGGLDNRFGAAGVVKLDAVPDARIDVLKIFKNKKVYLAGTRFGISAFGERTEGIFTAALDESGTLDATFGSAGVSFESAITPGDRSRNDYIGALTETVDAKVLQAREVYGAPPAGIVVRLSLSGAKENSALVNAYLLPVDILVGATEHRVLGESGIFSVRAEPLGNNGNKPGRATDKHGCFTSNGGYWIAGVETLPYQGITVRYVKPDDTAQAEFKDSTLQVVTTTVRCASGGEALVSIPNDVGAGYTMLKVKQDGTLDASFGTGGRLVSNKRNEGFGIDAKGRIVVVSVSDGTVTQLLPNGQPDPNFGTAGTILLPMETSAPDRPRAPEFGDDVVTIAVRAGTKPTVYRIWQ